MPKAKILTLYQVQTQYPCLYDILINQNLKHRCRLYQPTGYDYFKQIGLELKARTNNKLDK